MGCQHSTPIPTDDELNYFHPAPTKVLYPGLPPDKHYHLILHEKLWTSWSGDSFGVYYWDGGRDTKPFEVNVKGKAISSRDRMVLRDTNTQRPVAVMLRMFLHAHCTFKIYGLVPFQEGQAPSDNQTYECHALYEWAQCTKNTAVCKTMIMVDGTRFVAESVGPALSTHREMRIARQNKPCVYMQQRYFAMFPGLQWEIKIGPGIDPCMIIAFAVIMDEMNERTKRVAVHTGM